MDINGLPLRFCDTCWGASPTVFHEYAPDGAGAMILRMLLLIAVSRKRSWNYFGECHFRIEEYSETSSMPAAWTNISPEELRLLNEARNDHQKHNQATLRFIFGESDDNDPKQGSGLVVNDQPCWAIEAAYGTKVGAKNAGMIVFNYREDGLEPWPVTQTAFGSPIKSVDETLEHAVLTPDLFLSADSSAPSDPPTVPVTPSTVIIRGSGDFFHERLLFHSNKVNSLDSLLGPIVVGPFAAQVRERSLNLLSPEMKRNRKVQVLLAEMSKLSAAAAADAVLHSANLLSRRLRSNGYIINTADTDAVVVLGGGSGDPASTVVCIGENCPCLRAAIHIRRGDITATGPYSYRFIPDAFYLEYVHALREIDPNMQIHAYSALEAETTEKDFAFLIEVGVIMHYDDNSMTTSHISGNDEHQQQLQQQGLDLAGNGAGIDSIPASWAQMITADVLLMSVSKFSWVPGIFSTGCVLKKAGKPQIASMEHWVDADAALADRALLRECVQGAHAKSEDAPATAAVDAAGSLT